MSVAPGLVTIFCRACLDNPRSVYNNHNFGVVDAVFFSSRLINHTSIVSSSLRFNKRDSNLHEGVYDITANVVAYCEVDDIENSTQQKGSCKLMGDIVDFKPLAVSPDDPVGACKIPARVTVSGTVFDVDKERHSFMVFPTLSVTASPSPETLPVRAVLEKSPRWPNPAARLPSSQNFVAFTGKLAYFEDFAKKSREDFQSQAVIIVDSITYLCTTSTSKSIPHTPSTSQNFDADTVALKTRVLKYSQGSTSKMEDDSRSASSKTATSQEEEKGGTEV